MKLLSGRRLQIAIVGIILLAVLGYGVKVLLYRQFGWWDPKPYNHAEWLKYANTAGSSNERYKMSADVIQNHLRVGMPRTEVEETLGSPEGTEDFSTPRNPYQVGGALPVMPPAEIADTSVVYKYALGTLKDTQAQALFVRFDKSDKVGRFWIVNL